MDKIANSCNLYLTFSKDFFPAVRDLIEAENDEKGAACAGRSGEKSEEAFSVFFSRKRSDVDEWDEREKI